MMDIDFSAMKCVVFTVRWIYNVIYHVDLDWIRKINPLKMNKTTYKEKKSSYVKF